MNLRLFINMYCTFLPPKKNQNERKDAWQLGTNALHNVMMHYCAVLYCTRKQLPFSRGIPNTKENSPNT